MNNRIAIVGAACRYPDANSPHELWENVLASRRAFRRIPEQRLSNDYISSEGSDPDTTYVDQAAVLKDYQFDRRRYRVSGRTFRQTDMTHWLALDTAADALADAGWPDGHGIPKDNTAVILGNSLTGEFSRANLMRLRWPYVRKTIDMELESRDWSREDRSELLSQLEQRYKSPFPEVGDETLAGGLANTIAGRICNHFDFHGGGFTMDAACASSLLATANACTALSVGDADIVLAGGVDLSLDPFELIGFARVGALAREEMRVFDRRSAGFWPGEGCGFVVLMRVEDAIADNRRIYATIRGWGISSDGSGGISRPDVDGQKMALQRAYKRAGFDIGSVAMFEGHGTGTAVGDATELKALTEFRHESSIDNSTPAIVGSIKGNIGHTKAASGVAGLLKATWAIHERVLPPSTGCDQPNVALDDSRGSIQVVREPQAWPIDRPMRAGVSGMGFGGINVHLVLEGIQNAKQSAVDSRPLEVARTSQDLELFLFSAQDKFALVGQLQSLSEYASLLSRSELTDLSAELSRQLRPENARAAVLAANARGLSDGLQKLLSRLQDDDEACNDREFEDGVMFNCNGAESKAIGFIFPGQSAPSNVDGGIWRRRFECVDNLYREPFAETRIPNGHNIAPTDDTATEIAQPAIMRATIAGLRILDLLRVNSCAAIGNSLGELAAYHWAGAYSESTLMRIATTRGKAMSDCQGDHGAMASLGANQLTIQSLLESSDYSKSVVISGINSEKQTIVAGESQAIQQIVRLSTSQGISAVRLPVSHAFHSPLVAAAVRPFIDGLNRAEFAPLASSKTNRRVFSTITGDELTAETDLIELLEDQITSPVRFLDALQSAAPAVDLWIEVGPGKIMTKIAKDTIGVPVLSLDCCGKSLRGLLRVIGTLFVSGCQIDHRPILQQRFTRPFDLNWQATFLASPCELTPSAVDAAPHHTGTDEQTEAKANGQAIVAKSDSPKGNGRPSTHQSVSPSASSEPVATSESKSNSASEATSSLEIVRTLVADHAELPADSVKDDDRLLSDLHLSSIAVGQIVASAAKSLDLPVPVSPTDYATASVAEIASALQNQKETNGSSFQTNSIPDGVRNWIRSFELQLVDQPLPTRTTSVSPLESGAWDLFGQPDPWFSQSETATGDILQSLKTRVSGGGVLVCLSGDDEAQNIESLLRAAHSKILQTKNARFVLVQSDKLGSAFARTFYLENPKVPTLVLNVPAGHSNSAEWLVAELQIESNRFREVHYDASGVRREPRLSLLPESNNRKLPLDSNDVLLITGGAKGIAAECALSLARETGARLALLGRSNPNDPTVAANLERLRAIGSECQYWSVDVTDAESVANAIAEVTNSLGPVSAFLHGAGSNEPKLLSSLTRADFERTLGPKLVGIDNVLASIDPQNLKLLVTFGSIIARIGMPGEADYALANEWLANRTEQWQAKHPDCRCLAIEWSVWSGVGMGERLGRIDALKRQGITAITPDEGVRIMNALISNTSDDASHQPVAVVVAGRFGQPPTLAMHQHDLPFHRFVEDPQLHIPEIELIVDSKLSIATDPYLVDHAFQGVPLLPAVVGLEAMAQVASTLVRGEATEVFEFSHVEFDKPIAVPKVGDETIRVAAVNDSHGVELAIRCGSTGFNSDHFRARCTLRARTEQDLQARLDLGRFAIQEMHSKNETAVGTDALVVDPNPFDLAVDLYGGILFHQGRFKRVSSYPHLRATECIATIELPEKSDPYTLAHPWFRGYGGSETLLGDPGLHDATIHALQACIPHGTILPTGAERITFFGQPVGNRCFVCAKEHFQDGDQFTYDIEVIDESGKMCQRWDRLRLRKVSQQTPELGWATPLLTNYLQRRINELIRSASVEISMTHSPVPNGQSDQTKSARLTLTRQIGVTGSVHYRPDGKPIADCGRNVSFAHHGDLTMAIGSDRPIACDVEAVAPRNRQAWQDLLGSGRTMLAEEIALRAEESFDVAATRVWTAIECLKKHGSSIDAPLVLQECASDGWVIITAGHVSIATCATRVRRFEPVKLVLSALCEVNRRDLRRHLGESMSQPHIKMMDALTGGQR